MIYSNRKDNDTNHIIDMAEFFRKYEDICATDVTSNIMKIMKFQMGRKFQSKLQNMDQIC